MSYGKWQPFCLGLNVLTHGLIIELGYGFSYVRYKAITQISTDSLSIVKSESITGTSFLENTLCKTLAILFRPQDFNLLRQVTHIYIS